MTLRCWPTFLGALCLAVVPRVHGKLNVVVTTPELAAIARAVGGPHAEITTLAKPSEDPHFVDARPSFIAKLAKADALIEGGAELESGWLGPLLQGAHNPRLNAGAPGRIACAEGVTLLEVPTALDRAQGDVHAAGNPHFLMDPANAKIVAAHIAEAFCQIDSANCDSFRAQNEAFAQTLDTKLAEWRSKLAPFRGQRIVAYHNSWLYFSARFGVRVDLFLEPKPGLPPTPAHLATVIATMKSEKVRVILVEPFLDRKTAEKVARETGAKILDVSQFPGGVKGTERGYVELFDYLVNRLADALRDAAK